VLAQDVGDIDGGGLDEDAAAAALDPVDEAGGCAFDQELEGSPQFVCAAEERDDLLRGVGSRSVRRRPPRR
jgi:hypothetical protein